MDHEQLSRIFGGIFRTMSEYPGTVSSPMYKRAVKMMTTYLQNDLDSSVLEEDLVDWINSELLDKLKSNDCSLIFPKICMVGNLELAKWFVGKHQEVDVYNAFFNACSSGNFEIVKWLVEEYPPIRFISEDLSQECFLQACIGGHLEVVKFLVETFSEIDVHDDCDDAFCCACREGHLDLVKWFLETYPETNVDNHVTRPINVSCENGRLEVVEFLIEKYPNITLGIEDYLFAITVGNGHIELAEWLLEKYPEIGVDGLFWTDPLSKACRNGHLRAVKWFMARYPETVVSFPRVCELSSPEIVEFFLETRELKGEDFVEGFAHALFNNPRVVSLVFRKRPFLILVSYTFLLCLLGVMFWIMSMDQKQRAGKARSENSVHSLPIKSLKESLEDYQKTLYIAQKFLNDMMNYVKENKNITSCS